MANSGWSWHLFAAPAIWIARARRTPVVVNYRGGGARRFLEAQHKWVLPSLRRADVLAVPSGFLREVFDQFGVSAQIVPNAVDSRRFYPACHHSGTTSKELNLVIARNLEPIYDVATGIEAFAQILKSAPGARLQIAGDGPERASLESKVVELGISERVEFLGRVSGSRVAELYRGAYLVLNPTRVDNMPNSIIEALATGVPVVTTNVGGIPFIVDEGQTALLVEPGDPTAMAEASLQLINDSALWNHISTRALRSAEGYFWERVRDQWLEIYRALTGPGWDRERDPRAVGSRG
jgi:glycosyltransferase involved in cell wall biosynthesis